MRFVWSSLVLGFLALGPQLHADGWRSVPLFGADVRSLAFDPHSPERVLAGTSSGQIYESIDLGATWKPAGARVALPGWVISSLQFDPEKPGRVWAGLWALWGADGAVVVSDDGGRTWQSRDEGLPKRQVYALALAPDRADGLYAATRQGVWATEDAGLNWRPLTAGHPEIGKVTSFLVDPYRPNVLYAGTWRRAYRSDDRGVSWRGIFEGMVLDSEVFSLRPGARGEGDLWASTCGWVYHGRDRGGRWTRHSNGLPERRTPSFEVLSNGTLLAGTVAGVYGSNDQGASWRLRSPVIAVDAIAEHPSKPGVVLVASEGAGVWRSLDGGASFESSSTGMVSLRVTDIVPAASGLALSIRHAGRNDGVHRLRRAQLEVDRDSKLPTVLDLAADGERLFAATERGLWQRSTGSWGRVVGLGEDRIEEVTAARGRVLVRTAGEVVSLRGDTIERVGLRAPGAGVVWWADAVWFVDEGSLRRWTDDGTQSVETPAEVEAVRAFGASLVIDSLTGRFERTAAGPWRRSLIPAPRVLPTGDPQAPVLGLWADGSATLYDAEGRELTRLRLPVPSRDIAASVLEGGRLHLATAGYGLLWSNVLLIEGSEPRSAPLAVLSSR